MTRVKFGFVAEPHKNNIYLVSPATKREDGSVACEDLSGFLGSWRMKAKGMFFESESGETLCNKALKKATEYARQQNERNL